MWNEFKLDFAEKYVRGIKMLDKDSEEFDTAINETLYEINQKLSAHGKSNKDFHIPMPKRQLKISRMRQEETKYFKDSQHWQNVSKNNQQKMNNAQKNTFDAIISEYENTNRRDGFFAFVDETYIVPCILIFNNVKFFINLQIYS